MKALLPLALVAASGASAADSSRSYLLSIEQIPLKSGESIEGFSIETWGVEFRSVCRIPSGWRIKAGNSATPNGELEGNGSQGATWFNHGSPKELQSFVLVRLSGPVQREDIGAPGNGVPATFKGSVTISTEDDEDGVRRPLTDRNIALAPANRCPDT